MFLQSEFDQFPEALHYTLWQTLRGARIAFWGVKC